MRSRAVSLPLACCASMREGPPPCRDFSLRGLKLFTHHVDFTFENHAVELAFPLQNFERTCSLTVRSMGYNGLNHTTKSPRP